MGLRSPVTSAQEAISPEVSQQDLVPEDGSIPAPPSVISHPRDALGRASARRATSWVTCQSPVPTSTRVVARRSSQPARRICRTTSPPGSAELTTASVLR